MIELCVFAGLDQRGAAIALGVSVGTVKSRLHRARNRLNSQLREPATDNAQAGGPRTAVREVR